MSLILDALNKADRERDPRDAVPDINTVHGGIRHPLDQRRLLWLAGALGLLVVMLALLVLVLWLRQPAPAPAPVQLPVQVQASQPAPTGPAPAQSADAQPTVAVPTVAPNPPAPETPPAAAAAAPPTISPEVQALYGVQTDPVVQQVVVPEVQAAAQVITPETPRQSTVDEALALRLWEESKRQPLPATLTQTQDSAKKSTALPPPLDPDLSEEETMAGHSKIPFLHELPVTLQDTIPTLMYAKHDYGNRQVVINKTELRMGDATSGGVLIERVLADGVLLSFNGATFKLAAQSSWVNY